MTHSTTIYGIKNCDTVKKALKYLALHQIDYHFIDLKSALTLELLQQFNAQLPLIELINRQSRTWRQLDEISKKTLETPSNECFKLLLNYPTLLKRPILQHEGKMVNGFSESSYQRILTENL